MFALSRRAMKTISAEQEHPWGTIYCIGRIKQVTRDPKKQSTLPLIIYSTQKEEKYNHIRVLWAECVFGREKERGSWVIVKYLGQRWRLLHKSLSMWQQGTRCLIPEGKNECKKWSKYPTSLTYPWAMRDIKYNFPQRISGFINLSVSKKSFTTVVRRRRGRLNPSKHSTLIEHQL